MCAYTSANTSARTWPHSPVVMGCGAIHDLRHDSTEMTLPPHSTATDPSHRVASRRTGHRCRRRRVTTGSRWRSYCSKRDAQCSALSARLQSVPRVDGRPTVMFTPHELDEISTFRNRCPDAERLKGAPPPQACGLVMANYEQSERWRDEFAIRANRAWSSGGRVWISRRAFVTSPPESWKWAEGDDSRLHWREFPEYFTQVDVGPPVGGEDGFVEILPTPRTRATVERLRTVLSSED